MTSDSSYALPRADHFNPMMLSATPFSGLISGGDIALQSTLNICTIGVGAAVKSLKTQAQTPVVLKEPHPEDLDQDYLPKEKWATSGVYSRQQVEEIARLAGYDKEQIEAAFLLADAYDTSDEHDLCRTSDKEYERLIINAKRRLNRTT